MNSSYNSDETVAITWGRLKMTMSVSYTVFDGEIVSENRGGVESIYVPDTLGSTVAIISTGGVITDTFTYWPFGEIQTHVGSSVTPFTYVGTLGYYTDIGSVSIYVRARHYRPALTRWQTVDALWPQESSYQYGLNNPAGYIDPNGTDPGGFAGRQSRSRPIWDNGNCKVTHDLALAALQKCFSGTDAKLLADILTCIAAGESNCRKSDGAGSDNKGLFSLDAVRFNACRPPGCGGCRYDAHCNATAVVSFLVNEFEKKGGTTVADKICWYFGVLYCKGRKGSHGVDNSAAQGSTTMACLKAKGINIYRMKAPKPMGGGGCPRCPENPDA